VSSISKQSSGLLVIWKTWYGISNFWKPVMALI
jgi:hypothetical protein